MRTAEESEPIQGPILSVLKPGAEPADDHVKEVEQRSDGGNPTAGRMTLDQGTVRSGFLDTSHVRVLRW